MAYLFVVTIVALAVMMITVKKAADFLAWIVEKLSTKLEKKGEAVAEEKTEPL